MALYFDYKGVEIRSHAGLVLDFNKDLGHAICWNPETEEYERVSLDATFIRGLIDAPPALITEWKFQTRFKKVLVRIEQDENFSREELMRPVTGSQVIVRRGRKVAYGTTGKIFYEGTGSYGPRIGFETENGDRHFVTTVNVDVCFPGLTDSQVPNIGWLGFRDFLVSEKGRISLHIKKGERVRTISPIQYGNVFWVKDGNIGMNMDGARPGDKPVWTSEDEVAVFRNDVWVTKDLTPIKATPLHSVDIDPYLVKNFPEPFDSIRHLVANGEGFFDALTEEGNFMAVFPVAEAYKFWQKALAFKEACEEDVLSTF